MKFVLKVSCLKLLLYFRHTVNVCTLKKHCLAISFVQTGLVLTQFADVLCDFNHVRIEHIYVFLRVKFTGILLFFGSIPVSSEKSNPVRMGTPVIVDIVFLTSVSPHLC